jgi:hypothetical protein
LDDALTPTEDLLIEVLIARHRLGEPFWPFERCHRKTLERLEAKGLVSFQGAVTPHLRAELTAAGRERFMSRPYMPTGAEVEWLVDDPDTRRPVRFGSSSKGDEEGYHRRFADRYGVRLYRRAVIKMPLEEVRDVEH